MTWGRAEGDREEENRGGRARGEGGSSRGEAVGEEEVSAEPMPVRAPPPWWPSSLPSPSSVARERRFRTAEGATDGRESGDNIAGTVVHALARHHQQPHCTLERG